MQLYPGPLVDGRLVAAYQHISTSQKQAPASAVAAVAARCQQLLASMTPLPDDLKALAADPWTEQDDRWYYVALAQHYGLVRVAAIWNCSDRIKLACMFGFSSTHQTKEHMLWWAVLMPPLCACKQSASWQLCKWTAGSQPRVLGCQCMCEMNCVTEECKQDWVMQILRLVSIDMFGVVYRMVSVCLCSYT